jgi:hypothetical protein
MAIGTPSQLARQFVSEIHIKLEIDPAHADAAASVLTRFTPATPTLDASGLSVSGILHEQIPDVVAAMVSEGVRVYRVDHDEPTLEDVYFALHTATPEPV